MNARAMIVTAWAAALPMPLAAVALEKTETFDWTSSPAATVLEVNSFEGSAVITAGGDHVVVKAIKKTWADEDAEATRALKAFRIACEEKDGRVTVGVKMPGIYMGPGVGIKYEITAPADLPVVFSGGMRDGVETHGMNDVVMEKIGDAIVTGANKRVTMAQIYGQAFIEKSPAAIVIDSNSSEPIVIDNRGLPTPLITVTTSSADIEAAFDTVAAKGVYTFRSSSGAIRLQVGGDAANAGVSLATISGTLTSPFGETFKGGNLAGPAAANANIITAQTSSGDVTFEIAPKAAATE
jgi:hypothetical protein